MLIVWFLSKTQNNQTMTIVIRVSMDKLPKVEDVVEKNIFIYDIDIENGDFVAELDRRNNGKYEKTVKFL